jgi:phosphatidylserine/phosphatidylglycerophosphate/cardiolipin synthase-like enzyme
MKISLNAVLLSVLLLYSQSPAAAQKTATVQIYSSPEMNLGEVDRSILDQVGQAARVNFAAYVLSDYSIMDSLRSAAERGAHVRIYLDPRELEKLTLSNDDPFVKLWRTRNVEIKVKSQNDGLMHMKAYSVNGVLLRTGSANESHSGLERQDNDLVVITDKDAVTAFDRKFEMMWARPSNQKFSFE